MAEDIPVRLSAPFDFSFLSRYGKIFRVFDEQESGNISFGVESERWGKLFLKFAGAPTLYGKVSPKEAVHNLSAAMPMYEALFPHPALARLQGHGAIGGGYLAIFQWAEGISLYPGTKMMLEERYRNPSSPIVMLLNANLMTRLRMLDRVFDFHRFALEQGYMAVDFYDGSLIADFKTGQITVCDIDLYRPLPCVNDRGRMPGSTRFLSPEEYERGAVLDGVTLQYTMGALAFQFLCASPEWDIDCWVAPPELFDVAARACAVNRSARYPSYPAFLSAWRDAVSRCRF